MATKRASGRKAATSRATDADQSPDHLVTVTCQLAGSFTVKRLLVQVGDQVSAGQSLLLATTPTRIQLDNGPVEFMSEGTVSTPIAGEVTQLPVQAGHVINLGDALMVLRVKEKAPTPHRPLPHGKSRKTHLKPMKAAISAGDLAAFVDARAALVSHPDSAAQEHIDKALAALAFDPVITPELSRFLSLVRELVWDFIPGMTLEGMLEPLHNHGGGRPSNQQIEDEWLADYEHRKSIDRMSKSSQEIYEDMLSEENERRRLVGKAKQLTSWTSIRDGVSAARKRAKEGG